MGGESVNNDRPIGMPGKQPKKLLEQKFKDETKNFALWDKYQTAYNKFAYEADDAARHYDVNHDDVVDADEMSRLEYFKNQVENTIYNLKSTFKKHFNNGTFKGMGIHESYFRDLYERLNHTLDNINIAINKHQRDPNITQEDKDHASGKTAYLQAEKEAREKAEALQPKNTDSDVDSYTQIPENGAQVEHTSQLVLLLNSLIQKNGREEGIKQYEIWLTKNKNLIKLDGIKKYAEGLLNKFKRPSEIANNALNNLKNQTFGPPKELAEKVGEARIKANHDEVPLHIRMKQE